MRRRDAAAREAAPGAIQLTGGEFRGTRLFSPPGLTTRPALAKVRAALFNILGDVAGASVLDLFAGTGALGFEALSRGAARATFFERDAACLEAIRRSAEKLRVTDRVTVVAGDVWAGIGEAKGAGADVAFVDPPYAMVDEEGERAKFTELLGRMAGEGAVRKGGWVLVEHRAKAPGFAPGGMTVEETRVWGQTGVTFLTV